VSLVPNTRLELLSFLLEKSVSEKIKGDIIECGVYRGGSLIVLGKKLKKLESDKILYGLDTFEGHPYTDKDTPHIKGNLGDTSYNDVYEIIKKLQLENVKLLKGRFIDTFPSLKNKRFCFAHVDCNLYQSSRECLEFLLPRMTKKGIIFFEDYNSSKFPGANKAVEEFIKKEDLIVLPDKQAYYIKK
jgi:hypothetical protein